MRPKSTCRHLIIATALCALLKDRVAPAPVNPAALWTLLGDAQLVVLADVDAVTDCSLWKGLPPDFPPPRVCRGATDHLVAELEVRESWKLNDAWIRGGGTRLAVRFEETPVCPEPPRYDRGDRVIALLRHSGVGWETIGQSFGALHPGPDETESWRALILEALRLQAQPPVPSQEQRDWLDRAGSRQVSN